MVWYNNSWLGFLKILNYTIEVHFLLGINIWGLRSEWVMGQAVTWKCEHDIIHLIKHYKYTLIFINFAYGLLHVPNSISANSDNINILKLIMFHPCWVTNSKVCFVVPYSHLRNSLFIIELIWTTRIEYRNVTSSKIVCLHFSIFMTIFR